MGEMGVLDRGLVWVMHQPRKTLLDGAHQLLQYLKMIPRLIRIFFFLFYFNLMMSSFHRDEAGHPFIELKLHLYISFAN